ncbi:MAG: hypothetical protein QXO30_04730 [Candidatus Caldarchaeum sp.]
MLNESSNMSARGVSLTTRRFSGCNFFVNTNGFKVLLADLASL